MNVWEKLRVTWTALVQVLRGLMRDFGGYYLSPYPILLIIGAWSRLVRKLRGIWLPHGKGRPAVREDLVDLILDMKRANWAWGALRIAQELALLGVSLHKKTVQRILRENGLVPPRTRITPPTWSAFLRTHKNLWAIDFTCIFDSAGRQVFLLVVIDLATRQLVSLNATLNPCRQWITQQICNAEMAGFRLPDGLVADNDGIFGRWLKADFDALFGIKVGHIPRGMPWLNGICERFHRTLKSEALARILPSDIKELRELCAAFQAYYNARRPHQGIAGVTPATNYADRPNNTLLNGRLRYRKIREVGGLVTRFELLAA